ncbi:MAG: DUF177 domain-containing protein [Oscillospiraceae bacterium]|nr:DUF177 domain-containing protein [Oscillospiraceae bacterium]
MWLDLRNIIEVPGASAPFETTLDPEQLLTPAILSFDAPPAAEGVVVNTAGLLDLHAVIRARMRCVCDRCGAEFERERIQDVDAELAADVDEDSDGEVFPLTDDGVDVSELLETCFILDTDPKTLCREDCKGLCPRCGKNLNDGPCGCEAPKDPRFAVLEQLLDRE